MTRSEMIRKAVLRVGGLTFWRCVMSPYISWEIRHRYFLQARDEYQKLANQAKRKRAKP